DHLRFCSCSSLLRAVIEFGDRRQSLVKFGCRRKRHYSPGNTQIRRTVQPQRCSSTGLNVLEVPIVDDHPSLRSGNVSELAELITFVQHHTDFVAYVACDYDTSARCGYSKLF